MSNTCIVQRKRVILHSTMKMHRNMMSVIVTALSNQPEAFASDLGDDQSHYLFVSCPASSLVLHFVKLANNITLRLPTAAEDLITSNELTG